MTLSAPNKIDMQSVEINSTTVFNNSSSSFTTTVPIWINNQSSNPQTPDSTRTRRSTPDHIWYVTGREYYDDYEENSDENSTTPHPVPLHPCPYDRCKHLEPECEESQRKAGGNCLCPGLDGPTIPPDSPRLSEVTSRDTEVVVGWCSPMSTVQGYKVLYGVLNGQMENGPILNTTFRLYTIENLLSGASYRVCVVAFNEAGESPIHFDEEGESNGWENGFLSPCSVIHMSSSSFSHIYIGVGVGLAAMVVILGLTIVGYIVWKRKSKSMKIVEGEEIGIQNQSYKAGSMDQL
ncbi:hypothetical protein GDO86_008609 [Hymenochirus boettgeri]|uniref:Fibronectin type-III domain-containing protein n=1 Tax=Hymenochirus boettgeri TaxID=247094 RepID=A0A8T2J2D9_9PIPI|nr:hypothetical protein GDO86_008609 [Hymenochirus boettgeri]